MENTNVQNPIPEPAESVNQTPVNTVKPDNRLVVILSVSLLIVTFIAGFFALQTQRLAKQLAQIQTSVSPSPTPTATPDETANSSRDEVLRDWKTYSNNEYQYTLKYPQNWTLTEKSYQAEYRAPKTTKYISIESPDKSFYLGLGIKKSEEENVILTGRTGVAAGELIPGDSFSIGQYLIPTQHLIWENKIKDILGKETPINNSHIIYVEFSYVGKDTVKYQNIDLIKTPEYQIINQILSTFRFTE